MGRRFEANNPKTSAVEQSELLVVGLAVLCIVAAPLHGMYLLIIGLQLIAAYSVHTLAETIRPSRQRIARVIEATGFTVVMSPFVLEFGIPAL